MGNKQIKVQDGYKAKTAAQLERDYKKLDQRSEKAQFRMLRTSENSANRPQPA